MSKTDMDYRLDALESTLAPVMDWLSDMALDVAHHRVALSVDQYDRLATMLAAVGASGGAILLADVANELAADPNAPHIRRHDGG